MVPFSLRRDANGTLLEDPVLEEFDVVTVYSRAGRAEELPIQVTGEVREPVVERFQEGMTLRDAIIRAGGLRRSADPIVEVSRLADPGQREQGGIAQIFRIQVDSTYFVSEESARHYLGDPAVLRTAVGTGTAAQFLLRPHDRIFVRKIPQFELPRVVSVVGEVLYPGSYTLQRKDEKLRELLSRAGGLNSTAHTEGFRLYRGRNLVNVDLVAVLARADHPDNVILLPGDSLVIPEYNPVVTVQGAVNAPAAVLYKRGAKLDYYVANAGGYARNADRGRVHVRYANGSGRTSQRSVFFRTQPTPEPGSVVTVPLTPTEERTDTRALISDVAQIVGVLATVTLVALRR
jgi:protein involved in polysaccharide export with SLBB domain